jgi:enoyl-CoA hydratase/carnithine racemase
MNPPAVAPEPPVLLELGELTRLTLNRPRQANALDVPMGEAFEAAIAAVQAHPGVRAVLLCGAGSHFSGGGDFAFIEETSRLPREQVRARMLRFYQMYLRVLDLPVPTIAVVQGSAIGAGLCLALACDVRIGALSARLGVNFLRVGLHPGMGATALLPHVVGAPRAARLIFSSELVDGERAAAQGLLTEVVPDAELTNAAQKLASQIARAAPLAAREAVDSLRAPLRAALPAALAREAECQSHDFGSEDVRLAIEAFRRKQPPVFVGR